jgi:hypothetical protein
MALKRDELGYKREALGLKGGARMDEFTKIQYNAKIARLNALQRSRPEFNDAAIPGWQAEVNALKREIAEMEAAYAGGDTKTLSQKEYQYLKSRGVSDEEIQKYGYGMR